MNERKLKSISRHFSPHKSCLKNCQFPVSIARERSVRQQFQLPHPALKGHKFSTPFRSESMRARVVHRWNGGSGKKGYLLITFQCFFFFVKGRPPPQKKPSIIAVIIFRHLLTKIFESCCDRPSISGLFE